jgi:REP element-mobilizing transposase RayT
MNAASARQLELCFRSWGGARPGAGRSARLRAGAVRHTARPTHCARHPLHVTLRVAPGLPTLRSQVLAGLVRRAFRDTWRRWFRVIHFSIQSNHLHLLIEAEDGRAVSRGTSALCIRIARRLNALLVRRGTVFPERYHAHPLKTPREVRNAIVYVLLNAHKRNVLETGLDPYSSGAAFDGWKDIATVGRGPPGVGGGITQAPGTWLLARGWRIHGLIGSWERPAAR